MPAHEHRATRPPAFTALQADWAVYADRFESPLDPWSDDQMLVFDAEMTYHVVESGVIPLEGAILPGGRGGPRVGLLVSRHRTRSDTTSPATGRSGRNT